MNVKEIAETLGILLEFLSDEIPDDVRNKALKLHSLMVALAAIQAIRKR